MRFHRIAALVAAFMLTLGGLTVSTPATAAPTSIPAGTGINLDGSPFVPSASLAYTCTYGYMCLYENVNGGGAAYPIPIAWTGCRTLAGTYMDNRTTSIYNRTGYNWNVWQIGSSGCNEGGAAYSTIVPRSSGNMSAYWDDVITQYERQ